MPKEEIQHILLESIRSYFNSEEVTEVEAVLNSYDGSVREPAKVIRKPVHDKMNMFLLQDKNNGYYSSVKEPSKLFDNMVKQCDFSGLQDIIDDMIRDLKENYQNILIGVLSKRLADSFINDYKFTSELTNIIEINLRQRNNC